MAVSGVAAVVAIFVGLFSIFVSRFLDIIADPLKFRFFFLLSSNMEELEANTENLRARKDAIDAIILEDERQSRKPISEVEIWKKDVDAIMPDIQTLVVYYRRRCGHHRGFSFICSNYLVGIECADKLEKVKDLLKRGSFDVVTVESYYPIPIPTTYEVPGSLRPKHEEALEYVQNDDSANIIGIWGMGGVGKTTLLSKIHNSCLQLSVFDQVIWVDASRDITLQKIQRQIAQKLRLKESDDTQLQANIIFNFLQNKNFLLFIDDLWEKIDLKQAGVPNPFDKVCANKRKMIFTTRSRVICGNMEAKKIIKVDCLDDKQSWVLFKEKVGEQVIQSHPRISTLAVDVAKECKGLPLALITIGHYMSMRQSIQEWQYHLNRLRKSQVNGAEEKIMLHILKISYDNLATQKLKNCFLSVSMWPEDYHICKNELIQCWMGLDIIDDFDSMEEAYLCGFSLIGSLQTACLLEGAENEANFYDVKYVKMHDVLRDLAIWIASDCGENMKKWIIKAGIRLREGPNIESKWGQAERISLMHNHLTELPLGIADCSNLRALMLQRNDLTCKPILNCFTSFHFLEYLDLCGNQLNGFPEPICALTALRYLNLSFNHIEKIPEKIKDLEKLKLLILRENPIRDVPKSVLSKLVNLLVLDLFCAGSSSYVLCADDLRCLEKTLLYLGITIRTREDFNEISLMSHLRVGALCVQGLHDTSFHFLSMIPNLYCLKELNLQDGNLMEIVFDKNDIHQQKSSLNLEILILQYFCKLNKIIWKDITAGNIFDELREIWVCGCELLEDITWAIHLPSLHTLSISWCKSMRMVINDAENETNTYEVDPTVLTFPSLKRLTLNHLEKLEKISIRSLAFLQLETVQVCRCPLLKTMPFDCLTTRKIHLIEGEQNWWDKLVWKDNNSRSHFNTIFQGSEIIDIPTLETKLN